MKIINLALFAAISVLLPATLTAQVPQIINYQGRVAVGETDFDGNGQFKFALVDGTGTNTYWSNDGTSTGGGEPTNSVALTVAKGLFSVQLGDASLAGMIGIPATVFTNSDVRLRIWFDDGVNGSQRLSPDQRVVAGGYAMMAAGVPNGAITSANLADGAVTSAKIGGAAIGTTNLSNGSVTLAKLAANSVSSFQLMDNIDLGTSTNTGLLTVYRSAVGGPSVCLVGNNSEAIFFGTNGDIKARLSSALNSFGELQLYDNLSTSLGVSLSAGNETGGSLSLNSSDALPRLQLSGLASGAVMSLFPPIGPPSVTLIANAAGKGRVGADAFDARSTVDVGNSTNTGLLSVFRTVERGPSICLVGNNSEAIFFGTNSQVKARLLSTPNSFGELQLYDNLSTSLAASLSAGNETGGLLSLNNPDALPRVQVSGATLGGSMSLYPPTGAASVTLHANAAGKGRVGADAFDARSTVDVGNATNAGLLSVFRTVERGPSICLVGTNSEAIFFGTNSQVKARLLSTPNSFGELQLYDNLNTSLGVSLSAGNESGGALSLNDSNGSPRAFLAGTNSGGVLTLFQQDGNPGISLNGNDGDGYAAIRINGTNGTNSIILDADVDGKGKITTGTIELTGGSDLSEQFEITAKHDELRPGMLVCIDADRPGQLVASCTPYDRTVAGVISGAGGIKPGMMMRQLGTKADGRHPVALTGRVYCMVDAGYGAVRPGDLITTSGTPGHGMKVSDFAQAPGAIIGKAMSSLDSGTGLVLILVSLQ